MISLDVIGLDEAIARYLAMPAHIDVVTRAYLIQQAEAIKAALAGATPVDTGAAQAGWFVDDQRGDPLEIAVVNPVTSDKGFPYPSALLTGTGRAGAGATPTAGYSGGFGALPGMLPRALLQAEWNKAAGETLATPELVVALKVP